MSISAHAPTRTDSIAGSDARTGTPGSRCDRRFVLAPAGWESRLHRVAGYDNVFALDPYDLAIVKPMAGRAKDLELLRALLKLGILEPVRLRAHYQQTPLGEREAVTVGRNLELLRRELRQDG